ncbi:hypothetical protein RHGRI_008941 [Rhododendron griersonianum]|uniref:Uncharacterized protein n=1 Tax=Rhododendron griersonianum TaxID=479676 RepID=A0AAV6L4K6_9ERIC|nr:hypothetical protein RHGRI_008941 [Rhododendron griersonianum]
MKLTGLKSVENAHDDSVWAATWVPATDERPPLLLTGSLDETVRLWSSDELTCVATNTGHCLGVVSVAAHPSGVIATSASLDSFVRVFDVDHNNTIATLEAPPSEVWQISYCQKVYKLECIKTFTVEEYGCCKTSDSRTVMTEIFHVNLAKGRSSALLILYKFMVLPPPDKGHLCLNIGEHSDQILVLVVVLYGKRTNCIASDSHVHGDIGRLERHAGCSRGTPLAVAGGGSASVKLWDTAEWKLIASLSIPHPEGLKPSD